MNKNKVLAISIGISLIAYMILHAFQFSIQINSPYWSSFVKMGLGLLILMLPLFLELKWLNRLLCSTVMASLLFFIIPKFGIWNISLNHYLQKHHLKYEEYVVQHSHQMIQNMNYLSCRNGELITKPKLEDPNLKSTICKVFEDLDAKEVFINRTNSKYLFAMHRFIDNGYGILYSTAKFNKEEFFKERISGLEITSIHKVNDKWYYVTFT